MLGNITWIYKQKGRMSFAHLFCPVWERRWSLHNGPDPLDNPAAGGLSGTTGPRCPSEHVGLSE